MSTKQKLKNLLVIGPLPPPVAGTSVSFKLFCDFLENQPDKISFTTINTAPKKLGAIPLFSFKNFSTASRVLWGTLLHIRKSNCVLLFGSNQFLISLMPLCLLIAKVARKKFYVRSFGGSFDSYYQNLSPTVRRYVGWVLKHVDGLIVETKSKQDFFSKFMGDRAHLVPGYRDSVEIDTSHKHIRQPEDSLKLVYVGHIRKQKGVFDLLDSLQLLHASHPSKVTCDFYGPVYEEDSVLFSQQVDETTGATYGGLLEASQVIQTIANYDVFVFPSYYPGEGHPGVLIEAMMAGLPIVTTNFKAIPELIEDGFNGLLVSPNDPTALADTVNNLRTNKELYSLLKERSIQSGKKYSSNELIPLLLKAIDVDY